MSDERYIIQEGKIVDTKTQSFLIFQTTVVHRLNMQYNEIVEKEKEFNKVISDIRKLASNNDETFKMINALLKGYGL